MLLPGASLITATTLAERARASVSATPIIAGDGSIPLSEVTYRVGTGFFTAGVYRIATLRLGDDVIEVLGHVASVDQVEARLDRIRRMQRSLILESTSETAP